jgi:hypothetical protein
MPRRTQPGNLRLIVTWSRPPIMSLKYAGTCRHGAVDLSAASSEPIPGDVELHICRGTSEFTHSVQFRQDSITGHAVMR